jgi:hypothetical protein
LHYQAIQGIIRIQADREEYCNGNDRSVHWLFPEGGIGYYTGYFEGRACQKVGGPMSQNNNPRKHLYRYEDILRAIGRYIDDEGMQDVVILQADDELRVHGYRNVSKTGGVSPHLIEHTLTAEEIQKIDEESSKRRGRGFRLFG